MDLGDLFSAAPPPETAGRGKTTGDQVAELLGMMVFPALTLFLVAEGFVLGVILLPAAFAVVTLLAGMRLNGRPRPVGLSTIFCALACFMAGIVGAALAAF